MSHPTVASATFGNKEQITATLFTPSAPADSARPDFVSEGRIISAQSVAAAASHTSKSCRVLAKPGHVPIKTVYVESTQPGSFIIQVMLDESERIGGLPVWRNLSNPSTAFAADPGIPSPAVVNAWVMSVP